MKYSVLVDPKAKDKRKSSRQSWPETSLILFRRQFFRFLLRYRLTLFSLITFVILCFTGLIFKPFEKPLEKPVEKPLMKPFSQFTYPVHHKNFRHLIQAIKTNSRLKVENFRPFYNRSEFRFHLDPAYKCQLPVPDEGAPPSQPVQLLIVVKSAVCNFHLRNAIRQTWGNEQRFSDVNIKTVFMLGECGIDEPRCVDPGTKGSGTVTYPPWWESLERRDHHFDCQQLIAHEAEQFNDLVQANFQDDYYNTTLKTIACLQWVSERCGQVTFVYFLDDDYYLSVKNLLVYTRNIKLPVPTGDKPEVTYDGRLYAGFLHLNRVPHRSTSSKWHISIDDYPYDRYPSFIGGGSFLMNNQTVSDIYYASLYTKRFIFDDVYLGIIAYKMGIRLISHPQMTIYKRNPKNNNGLIASHGFKDPAEMAKVWFAEKARGFA